MKSKAISSPHLLLSWNIYFQASNHQPSHFKIKQKWLMKYIVEYVVLIICYTFSLELVLNYRTWPYR